MKLNKVMMLALLSTCLLALNACAKKETPAADSSSESVQTESADQMPNPFVEYTTVEEAVKHLDFAVTVPEQIDGFTEKNISVMSDIMFQIVFRNDSQEICIRKQAGDEDISGDYNEYEEEKMIEVDGMQVKLRGNEGTFRNVTWSDAGYSYSVYTDTGLSEEAVTDLVKQIR